VASVCLFLLPGFAMWEPRHSAERVPWFVGTAAVLATLLLVRSVWMALGELRHARDLAADRAFIAVIGCIRPRVVVSSRAERVLDRDELISVLDHEKAHILRQDNLRLFISRVLERLTPAPKHLAALRAERLRYTELAADESAATTSEAALQLASALVKVANMAPQSGLLISTFAATQSQLLLTDRVHRLVHLKPTDRRRTELIFDATALAVLGAGVLLLATTTQVQFGFYQLLEKLVSG
jgi:Zn-dependent protease with chaperone function